jgi:hypothetical protein
LFDSFDDHLALDLNAVHAEYYAKFASGVVLGKGVRSILRNEKKDWHPRIGIIY